MRSRLGRVVAGLEELRALLVAKHPSTARCQAGGRGRMLPLRQVLGDVCTERGQRIIAEAMTPEGLARSIARRQAMGRGFVHDREAELVARRVRAVDDAQALALAWQREDEAAARQKARRAA